MTPFKARTRIAVLFAATALSILGASLAFAATLTPARLAVAQTATLTVCVAEDTRVEQLNPDTSYGGDLRMEVDTIRGDGRQERIVSYVKFDLSAIPPGATLTSATLRLMVRTGGTNGTDYDVNVHSVPHSNWNENTMTWSNQPGMGGILGVLPGRMEPGQRMSASLSTSFYGGPGFYSFGLAYPEAATHSDGIDFGTKEDPADNDPGCLDVTYTTSGVLTPSATPTDTPAPTLTATPTDTPAAGATATPTDTPAAGATATPTDTPAAGATATPDGTAAPQPTQDPNVPVYTEADHRRAQAPLCADLGGQTDPAVRASVPGGTVPGGTINCRVLATDGHFPNPIDSARVGDPGLITYGIISAVDVFGVTSDGLSFPAFEHAVTVCLRGTGRLIYLSALNSPRTTYEPPAFVEGDYTCTAIPAAGTVVLIPPQPLN